MSKEIEQLEIWIDENTFISFDGDVIDKYDLLQKLSELKEGEGKEINIFEDSTYTIQFRDNLTSRGTSDFRIKGSELLNLMLPTEVESPVTEDLINDLADKRFVEIADMTPEHKRRLKIRKSGYKEGIKIGLSMKEPKQSEVSEDLINEIALKECPKSEFWIGDGVTGRLFDENLSSRIKLIEGIKLGLSMKERESIEFAEWIIKNEYERHGFFDNTSEGNIYISDEKPNKPFTMKELFNLFKSKTK